MGLTRWGGAGGAQCGMEPWELARIRVNLLKQAPADDRALAAEGKKDALTPLKNLLQPVLSSHTSMGMRRSSQTPASPSAAASGAEAASAGAPAAANGEAAKVH